MVFKKVSDGTDDDKRLIFGLPVKRVIMYAVAGVGAIILLSWVFG